MARPTQKKNLATLYSQTKGSSNYNNIERDQYYREAEQQSDEEERDEFNSNRKFKPFSNHWHNVNSNSLSPANNRKKAHVLSFSSDKAKTRKRYEDFLTNAIEKSKFSTNTRDEDVLILHNDKNSIEQDEEEEPELPSFDDPCETWHETKTWQNKTAKISSDKSKNEVRGRNREQKKNPTFKEGEKRGSYSPGKFKQSNSPIRSDEEKVFNFLKNSLTESFSRQNEQRYKVHERNREPMRSSMFEEQTKRRSLSPLSKHSNSSTWSQRDIGNGKEKLSNFVDNSLIDFFAGSDQKDYEVNGRNKKPKGNLTFEEGTRRSSSPNKSKQSENPTWSRRDDDDFSLVESVCEEDLQSQLKDLKNKSSKTRKNQIFNNVKNNYRDNAGNVNNEVQENIETMSATVHEKQKELESFIYESDLKKEYDPDIALKAERERISRLALENRFKFVRQAASNDASMASVDSTLEKNEACINKEITGIGCGCVGKDSTCTEIKDDKHQHDIMCASTYDISKVKPEDWLSISQFINLENYFEFLRCINSNNLCVDTKSDLKETFVSEEVNISGINEGVGKSCMNEEVEKSDLNEKIEKLGVSEEVEKSVENKLSHGEGQDNNIYKLNSIVCDGAKNFYESIRESAISKSSFCGDEVKEWFRQLNVHILKNDAGIQSASEEQKIKGKNDSKAAPVEGGQIGLDMKSCAFNKNSSTGVSEIPIPKEGQKMKSICNAVSTKNPKETQTFVKAQKLKRKDISCSSESLIDLDFGLFACVVKALPSNTEIDDETYSSNQKTENGPLSGPSINSPQDSSQNQTDSATVDTNTVSEVSSTLDFLETIPEVSSMIEREESQTSHH